MITRYHATMSEIRFYNSLTHQVELFQTLEPGIVTMYNCGPTVYDYAHIGNFRAFVFADVLRRFLELVGYDVQQVMNITDVGHMTDDSLADGGGEDKMAVGAAKLKQAKKQGQANVENPDDPYAVAEYFTDAFVDDAQKLGLRITQDLEDYPERMPRATDHVVRSMIPMIERLVDRDHAYVVPDEDGKNAVYFSVDSFPSYGRLSGNSLEHLKGGAGGRVVEAHQETKRHPADFLLWKTDPAHIMKWDSPWGEGYPGWHIECSAMSRAVLGREVIDIHTGGEDNIFPHHECEIAQSVCSMTCSHDHGEGCDEHESSQSFANYWMHTRFLLVNGEKMSKSKGNFYTVRDLLEGRATGRSVDPAVIRYELLKAHYRSNMNFTTKGLEDAGSAVRRLRESAAQWKTQAGGQTVEVPADHPTLSQFIECLSDDLNVAGAMGAVFEFLKQDHPDPAMSWSVIQKCDHVLGLLGDVNASSKESGGDEDPGQALAQQLDAARAAKDYDQADAIRQQLQEMGYDVKTTREGTVATKRLA